MVLLGGIGVRGKRKLLPGSTSPTPPAHSTIANGGIDVFTTAGGSTRFKCKPHAHEEAGRRNARNMRYGEASFVHLRGGASGGLSAAAAAAYRDPHNTVYGYKRLRGHGLIPGEAFVGLMLQRVEELHAHEGAGLGVPVPAGMCAEAAGTAQLRMFCAADPPPSFNATKMVKSEDPDSCAASTLHTDSWKRFPYLTLPGGALSDATFRDDDDDDDDDDNDSEDGEEHDEDHQEEDHDDGAPELLRAIINTGETDIAMLVRVPVYNEHGKHVASNKSKGVNEQFQTLKIVLRPGEIFSFLGATGVLLKHQAVISADGHASFAVMDYRFVRGAPSSRLAAPPAPPLAWSGWRDASLSAQQARGLKGGEERVLNPHPILHLDLCHRPRTDRRLCPDQRPSRVHGTATPRRSRSTASPRSS